MLSDVSVKYHDCTVHACAPSSSSDVLPFLYVYRCILHVVIPYTREHNDRSFYLKLVAAMGRYIYGGYLFMG